MDLFERAGGDSGDSGEPLAHRMRPRSLDEFVGQDHIVGEGRLLRRVIQADRLSSVIFYGPPGTGKTTLAWVVANSTQSHFITMNAVLSGVKDLRIAIDEAKNHRNLYDRRTLLFVDEVHRWNKAQQDALLPWVENGTVILIGATTENPFFEVNSALVSRSRIFQLKPLTPEDLLRVVDGAISDSERGYGSYDIILDDEAKEHLVSVANGDARSLLNAIELAVETTPDRFPPLSDEPIHITLPIAEESIQRKVVLYDKEGDYHFDTISAFIKSIRGSDPDAALYWMSRMVYAGEEPRYIFRRMLISAAEDIGLADPAAIGVVESAAAAYDRVGMPEGQFFLSEAALYLATTDKSNSTLGFFDAIAAVENEQSADIPSHLKDSNRDGPRLGHGEGYLYPHAYRDHWVAQHYLPESLRGSYFYDPGDQGYENSRRTEIHRRREAQLAAITESRGEVLTSSPRNDPRDRWLSRLIERRSDTLQEIRTQVFELAQPASHHAILDLNADHGLLLWEAVRSVPEGRVVGVVHDRVEALEIQAEGLQETERPELIDLDRASSNAITAAIAHSENGEASRFERIVGYNLFTRIGEDRALLSSAGRLVTPEGRVILAELLPRNGQLLADLSVLAGLSETDREMLKQAEIAVRNSEAIVEYRWDADSIVETMSDAGFTIRSQIERQYTEERIVTPSDIESWLGDARGSRYGREIGGIIGNRVLADLRSTIIELLDGSPISWRKSVLFLLADCPA